MDAQHRPGSPANVSAQNRRQLLISASIILFALGGALVSVVLAGLDYRTDRTDTWALIVVVMLGLVAIGCTYYLGLTVYAVVLTYTDPNDRRGRVAIILTKVRLF